MIRNAKSWRTAVVACVVVVAGTIGGALGWAVPSIAGTIDGADDAAFTEAVRIWLEDDEASALPMLSSLAQGGNDAARLLLALIDKSPSLQGPWLAKIARADRIALMRSPGGLSGQSWIHAAAESSAHAAMWQELWRVDARPELALEFAAAGEPRAARETLVAVAAREVAGLDALFSHPEYPRSMLYLGLPVLPGTAFEALHPGDPQRARLGADVTDEDLADWAMTAPEALGLRSFCASRCPDSAARCALAGYRALGDYTALMMFGSPSAVLIPSEVFAASARGEAALLRRAMLTTPARGRARLLAQLQEVDACFTDELVAEIDRYRMSPVTRE